MYASMATHPDITFATNHLSQFNSNPASVKFELECDFRVVQRFRGMGSIGIVGGGQMFR